MSNSSSKTIPSHSQEYETVRRIAAEVLAELSEHPEHWAQLPFADRPAKDADGNEVAAQDPSACVWCLQGLFDKRQPGLMPALKNAAGLTDAPYCWNDKTNRTLDDVIELCRRLAHG